MPVFFFINAKLCIVYESKCNYFFPAYSNSYLYFAFTAFIAYSIYILNRVRDKCDLTLRPCLLLLLLPPHLVGFGSFGSYTQAISNSASAIVFYSCKKSNIFSQFTLSNGFSISRPKKQRCSYLLVFVFILNQTLK